MKYNNLGETGLIISELGFGGIPIMRLDKMEAVKVLRHAFDRGITFFDTANAYRDSEEKMGIAFQGMRDKVVIATKTTKRDAAGIMDHLDNSLRMLQTNYIDLYQLHQVAQEKDWETLTGAGGGLETVVKAQKEGRIRCLGITSHSLPMAIKLVKTGLFSTVQFPFNLIETEAISLYETARELKMGFICMKPFGGGAIENAELAFKYLRQYPEVIAIPGCDSIGSIDNIVDIYSRPHLLEEVDKRRMEEYRCRIGKTFCRRCEYCQPCPQGVVITPAMGYPVMLHRTSTEVAVSFLGNAMNSVKKCIKCGICTKRCPYELPIPEMLEKHYKMFEADRAKVILRLKQYGT
jgi:predicted aldo/keto reductase-like oxidoreductase